MGGEILMLKCSACAQVNYVKRRGKRKGEQREKLALKKFCKRCRKHTVHRETKK